ncbi:MAG: type I phosphomannose isomerase catalytic subunit, partial [Anaerococcus hydrogenalis]|nr:type I phosphomannose isomerase catalytic subunit [Anaerococcus hydrogenalis]
MEKILFLKGEFVEKIWGGERLEKEFPYQFESESIGEYWAISAMEEFPSKILNGKYKGENLDFLYQNHKELFGNENKEKFPLLIKLIDANDDLSIQVHPDDEMAKKENSYGKSECWYILNEDEAPIIYGLKTKDKKDAIKMIDNKKWEELLNVEKSIKGDFFKVPAGMVHAIKKGSLILEIQQASDITYRLYDYDRLDKNGNLRDLHLEKSKEFGIYLMPFYVNLDGEFYKEQVELKPEKFYNWIKKNEKLPKTSIPSPGELKEKFDQIKNDGFEKLLIITISKNFTGFYNLCSQIEYNDLEIEVIDSQSVALTTGLLAIYAKDLIKKGYEFKEIVEMVEDKKKESKIFFTLDTFKYIVAGGRVPKAFGKVGELLNIKPIVVCDPLDGKYHIVKTCRGEKKVIKEMEKLASEYLGKFDKYYMIISNAGYKKG